VIFTSFTYIYFFLLVFTLYWSIRNRALQNALLLVASYIFYGWISPWFCILLATSTVVDYGCGLAMRKYHRHRRRFLLVSLCSNLGILAVFKYFNFFVENVASMLARLGLDADPVFLQVALPVGISFYTFQTLSYSIDIYRGRLEPRKNFIDFATFVAFFPQLVAGPIERARSFLPQLEQQRNWSWQRFDAAWPLILRGFFKKLVVADNMAFYVDKVYMLDNPGLLLLSVGTVAFSIQIYTDFSGYTDIARGTARLFGFELMRNFNNPYLAVTPSDFWRRWHISLSSWIRDYLFIPLGGSRHRSRLVNFAVILLTMTLCGLWHGAAWNYVLWGVYHGILLAAYHAAGLGGKWRPASIAAAVPAWLAMTGFTLFGWFLFRSPSLGWALHALGNLSPGVSREVLATSLVIIVQMVFLTLPLGMMLWYSRPGKWQRAGQVAVSVLFILLIVVYHNEVGQDFIYFQF
jgi:D-alanyl-lipoteichoic acid acyltransferase DltB (MBOAT superfamily)